MSLIYNTEVTWLPVRIAKDRLILLTHFIDWKPSCHSWHTKLIQCSIAIQNVELHLMQEIMLIHIEDLYHHIRL